jgi:hypothetical protein
MSWVTAHWDHPTHYELAPCSADLTLPCFDIMRCPKDKPMNVYVHNHDNKTLLVSATVKLASKKLPGEIALTANPKDACLFVVVKGSYKTKDDLLNDPLYMSTHCIGCQVRLQFVSFLGGACTHQFICFSSVAATAAVIIIMIIAKYNALISNMPY